MALSTLDEVRETLAQDLGELIREASDVWEHLVFPSMRRDELDMYLRTLLGFVMSTFAHVDALSQLWRGSGGWQTQRMRDFLTTFVGTQPVPTAVSIEAWRHCLMHTGNPPECVQGPDGTRYGWVAWWDAEDDLPPALALGMGDDINGLPVVSLGAVSLMRLVKKGAARFFAEAAKDPELAKQIVTRWNQFLQPTMPPL